MDKPENGVITKKKHENTLARAAEAHGRFWAQMHNFGHTKAWLLAGALWLFFCPPPSRDMAGDNSLQP